MGPRLSRLDAGREGVGEEETGRKPVLSQDGMEQGQAMTAFNAGQGDILQLWAPLSYVAEAKGWTRVSSGAAAKVMIAGGIGVRKEFA